MINVEFSLLHTKFAITYQIPNEMNNVVHHLFQAKGAESFPPCSWCGRCRRHFAWVHWRARHIWEDTRTYTEISMSYHAVIFFIMPWYFPCEYSNLYHAREIIILFQFLHTQCRLFEKHTWEQTWIQGFSAAKREPACEILCWRLRVWKRWTWARAPDLPRRRRKRKAKLCLNSWQYMSYPDILVCKIDHMLEQNINKQH